MLYVLLYRYIYTVNKKGRYSKAFCRNYD